MLYTAELAKEYLKHSEDIGWRNKQIENTVGLILSQMSDSLTQCLHSFKKSFTKPLENCCIDYLEHAGITVEFVSTIEDHNFGGVQHPTQYQYKFTF